MEWITSTSGAGVRDTGWLQGAYPTLNTDTLPRSGFVQWRLCRQRHRRHCFGTHLLEQKYDIRVIQFLLGHSKLDTTARYTHVAANIIREVISPLDRLTPLVPKKKDEPPE
jgi:hypothetical protein